MPSPVACNLSAVQRAGPVAGKNLRPACRLSRYSQMTGIEHRAAVVQDQRGDFLKRVGLREARVFLDRRDHGGDFLEFLVEPRFARKDAHFAHEWRCMVEEEFHKLPRWLNWLDYGWR